MNPLSILTTAIGAKGSGDSATARGLHGLGAISIAAIAAWILRWAASHAGLDVDGADAWIWANLDPQLSCHTIATGLLTAAWLWITKHYRNQIDAAFPPAATPEKDVEPSKSTASGAGSVNDLTVTTADQSTAEMAKKNEA